MPNPESLPEEADSLANDGALTANTAPPPQPTEDEADALAQDGGLTTGTGGVA